MDFFSTLVNLFLHIDEQLAFLIERFGIISYLLLFLVIFLETGLVVTPFLPGDSLLFAAGALAATGSLNIFLLMVLLILAAIVGDTANYWIGHYVGPKAFHPGAHLSILGFKLRMDRFFKQEYLEKAEKFYEKHGGKAIILARFVPIVRTFAPFVAGVGKMDYRKFISFNIIGGICWTSLFLLSGYFFGSIPFVQDNFHYVVLIIIFVSIIPIGMEWYKNRQKKNISS